MQTLLCSFMIDTHCQQPVNICGQVAAIRSSSLGLCTDTVLISISSSCWPAYVCWPCLIPPVTDLWSCLPACDGSQEAEHPVHFKCFTGRCLQPLSMMT